MPARQRVLDGPPLIADGRMMRNNRFSRGLAWAEMAEDLCHTTDPPRVFARSQHEVVGLASAELRPESSRAFDQAPTHSDKRAENVGRQQQFRIPLWFKERIGALPRGVDGVLIGVDDLG